MNWYKKAKLTDKAPSPDQYIYRACSFCPRWDTDMGWKKPEELDELEQAEVQNAQVSMKKGLYDTMGVSHGICDQCMSVINKNGYPDSPQEMKNIAEQSLALA